MIEVDDATRQEVLYAKIWANDPTYGTRDEDVIATVRDRIRPHMERVMPGFDAGSEYHVIDFGAGDGRFLHEMRARGLANTAVGIDVYRPARLASWLDWERVPMWEAMSEGDFVISTDALEHLPPNRVNETLQRLGGAAPHGFLRISLKEDRYGTERGLHLHESVFPSGEWVSRLRSAAIEPMSVRIYYDAPLATEAALEVWF
jgi:hypothetical protein